jgi:hypothetical protein
MTTPNLPLLWQTLETIQSHPENWEQAEWVTDTRTPTDNVCGTAFCFAGTALWLSGYEIAMDPRRSVLWFKSPSDGKFIGSAYFEAENVLRLGRSAAIGLFAASNTLDDLQRVVKDIDESAGASRSTSSAGSATAGSATAAGCTFRGCTHAPRFQGER